MADPVRRPDSRTQAQVERQRADQRVVTFRTIENEPDMDLVDRRQACSNHDLAKSIADAEHRGAAFPPAHEVCLKVLDVTARRGNTGHLFVNLALQHQGVLEWRNSAHDRLIENGEVTRTFRSIGRAARDGQTSYRTIRTDLPEPDQFKKLDCPLALDVGFTLGQTSGSQPMQVLSPRARDAVVRACYNPDAAPTIAVDGETMPLNKAGLLAGENIGRALRAELDRQPATGAPAQPITPPRTPPRATTGQAPAGAPTVVQR